MYYKEEDKEEMIKAIKRDIKRGMKIYSYYPVKGGWIYHSSLFCIHSISDYWKQGNGNKKE